MNFKYWILIAAGLFIIGIGGGIVVSAAMPSGIVEIFSDDLVTLEEFSDIFEPFQAGTAIFIFFKNVTAILFSFIFSPVLCLLPIIALLLNGSLIAYVGVIVIKEESAGLLLAGILPHGIIEIPAFIIGEAAALSFGVATIMALFSRGSRNSLLPAFKRNLKYLLVAFILLIPAAIIETYVTPLFLQ